MLNIQARMPELWLYCSHSVNQTKLSDGFNKPLHLKSF